VRLYNADQTERTTLLTEVSVRDFCLPTACQRDIRSSAMLRCVWWWLVADVSG